MFWALLGVLRHSMTSYVLIVSEAENAADSLSVLKAY